MPDAKTPLADARENESISPQPGAPLTEREFTVAERSQFQQALRRFLRHRVAVGSLVVFVLLLLFAFVLPILWKYKYNVYTNDNSQAPSLKHPFGTDNLGYDGLAVVMRGTQQSLKIAICIALLAVIVGSLWGVVAGFFSGWADSLLMRFADLMLTIPSLVVAGAVAHNFGGGAWWSIAVILGALSTPYVARVVRGSVLALREREYIEAARALGATNSRIMFRHLLPNVFAIVIVNATLLVATGILGETALSFLGLGVKAPDTSLGLLITTAQGAVETRPWLFYFPGLFIILIALTVNFIGDGLRDALDPRQTRQRR